jgi:AcrR family transcriptional regulator
LEAKENNILHQAKGLIFKYGIKSLTMDDIAQHLGISKKTLYLYYDNKADLINKILTTTFGEHKSFMSDCFQADANPIDEIITIFTKSVEMVKQMNPSLDWELKKYYPESYAQLYKFKNEFIFSTSHANLIKGVETGYYRTDFDPFIIAKLHTCLIVHLMDEENFSVDKFTPQQLMKHVLVYHLHGITNEKGEKYLQEKLKEMDSIQL